MSRWLVVIDPPNGIAELLGVLIVEAESSAEAKEKARDYERYSDTSMLQAFKLDDIQLNGGIWSYYQ